MSRLRRCISSALLASTLFAGACSPAVTRGPADPGKPAQPIARPDPKPGKPSVDRARLRAALEQRRAESFARFLAYREGRVYPVNNINPGFAHIWLDAFGNLCAAATIISSDWGRQATERVAQENNFLQMADVEDGPLHDWILTSGLTHHEIVAIQVPGFAGGGPDFPQPEREAEIARMYDLYIDVERQLKSMWDDSLDDALDELVARPDLALALIDGYAAGPGRFAVDPVASRPSPPTGPRPTPAPLSFGFAQPPP